MLNKIKELTKDGYSLYFPPQSTFGTFAIYLFDDKREIGWHTEISDEELAATILDPELYVCEELDRLKEEIKKKVKIYETGRENN